MLTNLFGFFPTVYSLNDTQLKLIIMKEAALENFFGQYVKLTQKTLKALAEKSVHKTIPKGKILLRDGQTCNKIYFVIKGCLRLYYISNDIETTVWFSFENNSAIELSSFLSGMSSEYYLEAIEDSEILTLHKIELTDLYRNHPSLERTFRIFWENVIPILLKRFTALQKDSAETRYLDLLKKHPEFLQRIPQKYLASYIGITPTSLSRIRRNIV